MPAAETVLACPSRIAAVTVYARGAIVRRRVELPAKLPGGACELSVAGLPALAEPGSFRAHAAGGRQVVALKSQLILPADAPAPEGVEARLRELDLETRRLALEAEHLQARRDVLLTLTPRLRGLRRDDVDPASRARDALAANALVTDLSSSLDARLRELVDGLRAVERERGALLLEQRAVGGQREAATRSLAVRLGPDGVGALDELAIEYVVSAARWWPAYTARLSEGGTRAEWALEAFVAQTSGEDWEGVRLTLSTADLITDARLPELASLRLGRSQPPRASGFRPPPEGLDALFAGYDRDQGRLGAPPPPPPKKPKPVLPPAPEPEPLADLLLAEGAAEAEVEEDRAWMRVAEPEAKRSKKRSISFGRMAAPAAAQPAPAPGGPVRSGGAGGARREEPAEPAPGAIEPADAWLDFDGLVLGAGDDPQRRGRLRRVDEPAVAARRAEAEAALAAVPEPNMSCDPVVVRGRFDHQHQTEGRVDVASRREAQRITISASQADARPLLQIAPGVEQAAYREVELANPTEAPLLTGPVDVFLEGSLLTTSRIRGVGRGGLVRLGLGVEDRVRVARNVRVSESTAGLIGKTTAVEHTVTIELRSSLPHAVTAQVVDRVPVTDDEEVTVELVRAEPAGEDYDQQDREARIRGGRRWTVELPAGGEARIELVYRVSFPSRRELLGGNRRD